MHAAAAVLAHCSIAAEDKGMHVAAVLCSQSARSVDGTLVLCIKPAAASSVEQEEL